MTRVASEHDLFQHVLTTTPAKKKRNSWFQLPHLFPSSGPPTRTAHDPKCWAPPSCPQRERERELDIFIYVYIYIYIQTGSVWNKLCISKICPKNQKNTKSHMHPPYPISTSSGFLGSSSSHRSKRRSNGLKRGRLPAENGVHPGGFEVPNWSCSEKESWKAWRETAIMCHRREMMSWM